jgi:hypothetical protein
MAISTRLFISQTWALTKKTLIIAVVRNWLSTAFRALILPITFLVLLLNIKNLILGYGQFGVGSPAPVQSLADAIPSSKKLVFVQPSSLGPDAPGGGGTAHLPYKSERPPNDMQAKLARRLRLLWNCSLQRLSIVHGSPVQGSLELHYAYR